MLTSFAYRFFLFSRPSGLGLSFDAAERNRNFGRIQCPKSKESSSKGKRGVFLCRRTVKVEVKSTVIPTSFRKRMRVVRWSGRAEKEVQLLELVCDQSPEAPPRNKRGERKRDARRGATARRTIEKSWCVGVIEKK